MKFAGITKTSTMDYPKNIVSTVYTNGCNFRCEFCHNGELVEGREIEKKYIIDEDEIIKHLQKRKNMLDGICITGGEPTIWGKELIKFMERVKKELGNEFLIKLDTNGSNPDFIIETKDIVDFYAIDFKSLEYEQFSKIKKDIVLETIENVKEYAKDYEIRCTMYPKYIKKEDFEEIARLLSGAKKVAIQQFNPDKVYIVDTNIKAYSNEILEELKKELIKKGIEVEIRA
ncbi:MAG: anaerobic ribonucleoside-triphosphate reductase activating protein [Fusobacteriia bacterium 4572_132]|nr:MAG: anaerobic ribonucleoside-triphosphate reductase activating protein [Fusobacteriia bacterium 4572_132]